MRVNTRKPHMATTVTEHNLEQIVTRLYEKGNYDSAMEECDMFILDNPNSPEGFRVRHMLNDELNYIHEATEDLKAAIKLGDTRLDNYERLGVLQYQIGKYEDAISSLEEVLKHSQDYSLYLIQANSFMELKQIDKAKQKYQKSVEISEQENQTPLKETPHERLERLQYLELKIEKYNTRAEFEESIDLLSGWLYHKPLEIELYKLRAITFMMQSDIQEASNDLERILKLEPEHPQHSHNQTLYNILNEDKKLTINQETSQKNEIEMGSDDIYEIALANLCLGNYQDTINSIEQIMSFNHFDFAHLKLLLSASHLTNDRNRIVKYKSLLEELNKETQNYIEMRTGYHITINGEYGDTNTELEQ